MGKTRLWSFGVVWVLSTVACTAEEPQPVAPTTEAQPPAAVAPPPVAAPATQIVTVTAKSPEAVELFKSGRDLAENARATEAIEAYKKAVQLDPGFALALASLGQLDQTPEGLQRVDQAAALTKSLPEAERLQVEAIAAAKHGDADKAFEADKKVLALAPADWRAHFNVGADLSGRRQWDASIVELKKAAEINPNAGAVYNLLGYAYSFQNKPEDAIGAFKRYAEVSPTQPNAHDSLGDAYLMANRLPEAETSYRQAVAVNPGFFFSWNGVAVSKLLRGDFPGGFDALAKVKSGATRPVDQADADQNIGWALLAQGRGADALKAFDALEKWAGDQKLGVQQALAAENHAFALVDSGKAADGVKQIDAALDRAQKAGLSADDLTWLGRWGLTVKSIAQQKLSKGPDAQKSAAEMSALAQRDANNPFTQSAVHLTKGLAAWAGGDAKGAVVELAQCQDDDAICRWQLALAQKKAGDKAGAEATKTKLVATPRRDVLYVFARIKLAGAPTPPKSK